MSRNVIIYDENANVQNLVGRTPTIINKTLTTGGTEYEQDLPDTTRRFTIQARVSNDFKLSFTDDESGTKYITIKAGATYTEENVDLRSKTLYLQSETAGLVVEIIAWT